ncbi:MAG: pyruvate kinase [Bryobacteraceae bacterium]
MTSSTHRPWNRTKIVCTMGPSTDAPEVLEALIAAGMDVARINASFGADAEHSRRVLQIRGLARRLGQPVAILMDLPGPKYRVADLPGGSIELTRGSRITLAPESDPSVAIVLPDKEMLSSLQTGEEVYLTDGSVKLRVLTNASGRVDCEVVVGGAVRSGSGVNFPESTLSALIPTAEDRRHIQFAVEHQLEWIGVSYVQSVDDLARIRAMLPKSGDGPYLMAKIERRQALAMLDELIEAADGVMVARGDLGVETDLAKIPMVQKRIIALANAKARPVVTATQMLESMVKHERPTRAEVTDVANALLDGTDGVMLSAETAIGRYPVAAAEMLQRVLAATEAENSCRIATACLRENGSEASHDSLSFVACQLALRLGAKAIVAPASSMAAALAIARFRPIAPVLIATESEHLYRSLAAVRGVSPLLAPPASDSLTTLNLAREWLLARNLAQTGDALVVLSASSGTPAGPAALDTLQVAQV